MKIELNYVDESCSSNQLHCRVQMKLKLFSIQQSQGTITLEKGKDITTAGLLCSQLFPLYCKDFIINCGQRLEYSVFPTGLVFLSFWVGHQPCSSWDFYHYPHWSYTKNLKIFVKATHIQLLKFLNMQMSLQPESIFVFMSFRTFFCIATTEGNM